MAVKTAKCDNGRLMLTLALCLSFAMLLTYVTDMGRIRLTKERLELRPTMEINVREGDTLWGIARSHSIEGVSTYDLVEWLYEQNELPSSCLAPGQTLRIPVPQD